MTGSWWDIVKEIAHMPWYKVMAIAIADDIILILKLWPLYLAFFVGCGLWILGDTLWYCKKRKRKS